jgi:hypothetical protein
MKIANLLLVAAVFLAPVPIVLATLGDARFVWLNYGIWLSAVVSFVLFLNYYLIYRRGRKIDFPYWRSRQKAGLPSSSQPLTRTRRW